MYFFWYLDNIPSVQQWLLYTNSNILTWIGLVKTVVSYGLMLIPEAVKEKVIAYLENLLQKCPHKLTQHIEEYDGRAPNQLFVAAEDYLRTKVTPSLSRLHVAKLPRVNKFLVSAGTNQAVTDIFEEVEFTWTLICNKEENSRCEKKWYELSFEKQYDSIVLDSYLPYVMQRAKVIQEENRTVRLYSLDICIDDDDGYGSWGSIKFEHPSTFDTIAIDPEVRKELLQDFDKFLNRRDYYRGVGKAWKRGYLLYGPPGTGKTTLIAAMANYLNFNIYDLELASVQNSDFRNLLISTTNRSILVIEDIDCTVDLKDREEDSYSSDYSSNYDDKNEDLTLSGLLNFIDGLWSSVGDERIIVFTTNHKDKLDPALLRPGRMDMHIHMSYITPHGFRTLVNNYLQINEHFLFEEIDILIQEVNVTAAEVAEELMKSEDAEIALRSVIDFIKTKKTKLEEKNNNVEKKDDHGSKQEKGKNKRKNNNRNKG